MTHANAQLAYVFLIGALISLGGLGILHKVADRQGCRASAISFLLFFWAALLVGAGYGVFKRTLGVGSGVPHSVVLVAAVCGALASLAILSFQAGLRYGEIATSWLIINLSTALPTALSIVIYKEEVGFRRGFSLMLAVSSLALLWQDWKRQRAAGVNPDMGSKPGRETHERRID